MTFFSGKDVPSFEYTLEEEGDEKTHVYHPDMYISSTNTIVEVKSRFTYDRTEELEKINHAKWDAVYNTGKYNFEMYCFDRHKLLYVITYDKNGEKVVYFSL